MLPLLSSSEEGLTDTPLHKAAAHTQPTEDTPVEPENEITQAPNSDAGDTEEEEEAPDVNDQYKLTEGRTASLQNDPVVSADEEAAKDESEDSSPEEQEETGDEGVSDEDAPKNKEADNGDEEEVAQEVNEDATDDDDEGEDGAKTEDDQPAPERYNYYNKTIIVQFTIISLYIVSQRLPVVTTSLYLKIRYQKGTFWRCFCVMPAV